jgi:hypothetical protein
MSRLITALGVILLIFLGYFDATHHPVYSKNCKMTPDGLSCALDHWERNK